LSVNLACVEQLWCGSVHICPVGHTESCTPVVHDLLCTSSARSYKAQSLVQYCSCCTWLTLRTLLTDTVSLFTRLPMTRSCTCIAAVKTSPRQPLGSRSASSMLVAGCPLTGSNWTRTRLSCSGLGQTAYLNSMVMVHLYNWAPILSQLATMCGCLEYNYISWSEPRPPCVRRQFGVLYWLRQLRRVRWSLDDESAAILVHAFVTSRVDYCNLLLAGAPKSVTDKLQQVMNAAARVVSGTKKYDHGLTHLLHSELHWLDVADRVTYKLGWRCTSACMARHRIICLSCVHRSLKLLNDSIFVPPAAIYSLFNGFSSIRTAVAPSLSLDQRHRTCSKTICVSRTCKLTVFVVHWRRVFLISTRHTERIRGAFCDDALYKLTFTLYYKPYLRFQMVPFSMTWLTSNPHFKVTIIFNVK